MGKKKKRRSTAKTAKNAPSVVPRKPDETRIVYVPQRIAGMYVDHDQALRYSAVFACIRYISESIAALSWHHMRRNSQNERIRVVNSQTERLLNTRANPEMSGMAFRETMLAWALAWGNGYAEIVFDGARRPVELWPVSPDRVQPDRDPDTGAMTYKITDSRGGATFLPPERMFHLHGLGFDGRVGYSVVSYAARSVGVGIAQDEYSGSFFGNNTQLSGVFELPGGLSDVAYERLKKDWEDRHKGPGNAWRPAFLEDGMKWKNIGVPPEDAQLIESKQFSIEEIARWFNVKPHKIGHLLRATFSNIEHQAIESVTDTLIPWITRLEQEANYKLTSTNDRVSYTKINVNALLRGDLKSRSEFYNSMLDRGVFSINEVRELEDLNPIPNGDLRLVPMNMQTLEQAALPPPEDPSETEPDIDKLIPEIEQATIKSLAREQHRITDAVRRYKPDRVGFLIWLDVFYNEHKNYMKRQYLNAVPQLSADYLQSHINSHAQLSQTYAIKIYDENIQNPNMTDAAKQLTQLFLQNLKLTESTHNERQLSN